MRKWLIEIRGKLYAADANQVVHTGIIEARLPSTAANTLHSFSDDDFWDFHYYDFLDVTDVE